MSQTEIKQSIYFFVTLLFLNFVYFFIYFIYLDSFVSIINLWFITLSTLSYFVFIHFFKRVLWEVISYLILAIYFSFCLINFAYFKVFGTFIDLRLSSANTINASLLDLLKDYFFLIPLELMLVTIVIFIGIIIAKIFIEDKKANPTINFQNTKIQIKSHRKFYQFALLILVFAAINLIGLGTSNYFINNPKDDWWDIKNQLQDIGVIGHLYTQAAEIEEYSLQEPIKTEIKSNSDPLTRQLNYLNSEHFRSLSPLEKTKTTYKTLETLAKKSTTKVKLPQFETKPNVLIIQLESVGSWAINNNPTPMPYLKSLIENNISIPDFHANSCETINAEFATICSYWPNSYEPVSYSHLETNYNCMPSILDARYKYDSYFFHANLADFWRRDILAPAWGFENQYFTPYYKQKAYDKYVYDDAVNTLSKAENPFYAYIVTFTAHSPHNLELIKYHKKSNNLDIIPFDIEINPEYTNLEITKDEAKLYYGFLKVTDDALKFLMEKLEKNGILDDTIVIIHNDHRYYNFLSNEVDDFYNYNVNPFVMILPDKQKGEIQHTATHSDIAPTILNLIEGENYQKPNNFIGNSMFETDFPNQAFNKCLGKIYYKNDDIIIQGNAKTNQYYFSYEKYPLSENKKDIWQSLLTRLIQYSDEAIFNNQILE